MYGWRGWVLGLGLLCGLNASAADEDYQRLVDNYLAVVSRAEAANDSTMLLAPNAIRIIDELTDRRRLQGYGSQSEDLDRLIERGKVIAQLSSRIISYKPAQYSEPRKRVSSIEFRGPLAKLYANSLLTQAKLQENQMAYLASTGVSAAAVMSPTEVRYWNANSRRLFIEALYMIMPPYDKADQYRIAEALLTGSADLLDSMPPEKRRDMLPDLDAVYRIADPSVRPLLDKIRQQLLRQDCVKFCALL